jgi:hypothetical protein
MVTGICDGWKNIVKQSIIAMMVMMDQRCIVPWLHGRFYSLTLNHLKAYLIKTHDISTEQKTGEFLLGLMLMDIQYCQDVFGLDVIGFCCDNGGDCQKFCGLLNVAMVWLMIILCWAHQINLIVGDFLSLKIRFLSCVPNALEVNHSHALGLFQSEQRSVGMGKVLALILPVIMRWTAHYCSLHHLLEVQGPMKACWIKYAPWLIECTGTKVEQR